MIPWIKSFVCYLLSALGTALTVKASVGVGSFVALNVSLGTLLDIKVGTLTAALNGAFLVCCLLLDKQRQWYRYGTMLLALLSFGQATNLFLYIVMRDLVITSYLNKVLLFALGVFLIGFGFGRILHYGLMTFPIEYACQLLAGHSSTRFRQYRYFIDIICVSSSLLITLLFHQPLVVREGTLISLVLLSSIMSWAKDLKLRW